MARLFGKGPSGTPEPPLPPPPPAPRPAFHLVATEAPGFSRLGGLPELSPGLAWPARDGRPLAFLAQLDLAEGPASGGPAGLPRSGRLFFFYDLLESPWGFDPEDRDGWAVLRGDAPGPRAARPADLPEEAVFPERRVDPRPLETHPDPGRVLVPGSDGWEEALDEAQGRHDEVYRGLPRHQVGGYPSPVQRDDMELECQLASHGISCGTAEGRRDPRAAGLAPGAAAWTLLLQLDSDPAAGMMWGDAGRLYFWIRAGDLARGDFSRVWVNLQCG